MQDMCCTYVFSTHYTVLCLLLGSPLVCACGMSINAKQQFVYCLAADAKQLQQIGLILLMPICQLLTICCWVYLAMSVTAAIVFM